MKSLSITVESLYEGRILENYFSQPFLDSLLSVEINSMRSIAKMTRRSLWATANKAFEEEGLPSFAS